MNVFKVTDPLPRGTTVLEASAGTGKTWMIAALATRLIAEGTFLVTDLLIVTFTRAATQELRSRVRARLQETARALATLAAAEPELDDLTYFLATGQQEPGAPLLPPHELEARITRLRAAVANIDAATITTIHGFCHTVLEGIGVVGDTDTSLELVESAADIVEEVVDDLYLEVFAREESVPAFSHGEALEIATAVINNPTARVEPAEPPAGAAGPMIARRVGFAQAVRAEVRRRKRELGILTYDDLLSRLAESLDGAGGNAEPARERLRGRWRMVLIDEFQDTDDTQWRILKTAFHGHRDLILIGDPKQAIYAFRGGDITTYLTAINDADHRYTLAHNYRSDAELIESFNGVLGGAELGDEQIVVHEVSAGKGRTDVHLAADHPAADHPAPGAPRMRVRVVDIDEFSLTRTGYPRVAELREAIARDVATDISHLLAAGHEILTDEAAAPRQVEASDIAVLCHANRDANQIQQELSALGIHSVVSGGTSVFTSSGADEWLTLLDALDQPGNVKVVSAAALTPFFGYTAAELVADSDTVIDAVTARVRDFTRILAQRGIASVFEAAQGWGRRGLAARVLPHTGGERLLTDIRHLAELMQSTHPRAGANTLATWIREEREKPGRSEHLRRLESDAEAVQLLTIHSAKGLQFPFVYLPTVGMSGHRNDKLPLFHLEGARVVDVSGAVSKAHAEAARDEAAGEALRLLYVAMTRAVGHVTAYWAPASGADSSPFNRILNRGAEPIPATTPAPAVQAELTRRWGEHASIEPVEPRSAAPVAAPAAAATGAARTWTRGIDTAWRRSSYTSLSEGAEAARTGEAAAGEAAAGGTAPGAGTPPAQGAPTPSAPTPSAPTPSAPTPGLPTSGASEPEINLRSDEEEITLEGPSSRAGGPSPAAGDLSAAADPTVAAGASGPGHVPSPMANLPKGAQFGSLVHGILETVDTRAEDLGEEIRRRVEEQLLQWPQELDPIELAAAVEAVLRTPLAPALHASLGELDPAEQLAELDFELPLDGGEWARGASLVTLRDLAPILRRHLPPQDPLHHYAAVVDTGAYDTQPLRGYLTGSIDLVFRSGGKFYVADYKTNWLGPADAPLTTATYDAPSLNAAMRGSSYPLQALLYTVALHRYLIWRVPGYDPAAHIGGVLYLYVRGMAGPQTPILNGHATGVFSWAPPPGLISEISSLLDGDRSTDD